MKKRILGIIGGSGLYQIEGLENMVFYGFALLILVMVVMMMAMTCSLKRRGYNKVYSGDTDLE